VAGRHLVSKQLEQFRFRTDECDACLLAGTGKCRVLRKKPVAGMDGIDLFLQRKRNNAVNVQVGLNRALSFAYK
jgi:hypothetical protein